MSTFSCNNKQNKIIFLQPGEQKNKKKIDLKKKTSMPLLTVTNQIAPATNTKAKG